MHEENQRERVMFDWFPAQTPFVAVPYARIPQKKHGCKLLHPEMEIGVFYRCKGETFIESADAGEELPPDGKITGPKVAAGFIFRAGIREPLCSALGTYASFKDANFRMLFGGILVGGNQTGFRSAVVVEEDEQYAFRMRGTAVSVGGWSPMGALDNVHNSQFAVQHRSGYRGVTVIAHCD